MENFNEIELTPEEPVPREMRPWRAVFLMIATLLLWCGSMLLVLDLAANASGTHGQVAMIGLVLVAIGGSCLWADFFEVTSWFARERWVTGRASTEENNQAEAHEGHVQEVSASQPRSHEGYSPPSIGALLQWRQLAKDWRLSSAWHSLISPRQASDKYHSANVSDEPESLPHPALAPIRPYQRIFLDLDRQVGECQLHSER